MLETLQWTLEGHVHLPLIPSALSAPAQPSPGCLEAPPSRKLYTRFTGTHLRRGSLLPPAAPGDRSGYGRAATKLMGNFLIESKRGVIFFSPQWALGVGVGVGAKLSLTFKCVFLGLENFKPCMKTKSETLKK